MPQFGKKVQKTALKIVVHRGHFVAASLLFARHLSHPLLNLWKKKFCSSIGLSYKSPTPKQALAVH
jgi:hypothetical protein